MHISLKEKILAFLDKFEGEIKFNTLATNAGIKKSLRPQARNLLNELVREGKISKQGKFYQIKKSPEHSLKKSISKTTNQRESSRSNSITAKKSSSGDGLLKYVPGKFQDKKHFGIVIPESRELRRDIIISVNDFNGAENGDKVFCEILNPEDKDYEFSDLNGKILNVFGKAGEPDAEILSVMAKYGLIMEFPKEVKKEADKINENFDLTNRRDIRDKLVFTIDPYDAKDFDDAVSLEKNKEGNFILGVHIADVAHFVTKDSQLDKEAKKRGTSVYLVNQVIPMLPEKLSNEICSLKPDVDRLAFSVFITLDKKFKIVDFEFAKTIINSKRRFTYEEVQHVIETGKGDHSKTIKQMQKIANHLTKERIEKDSLDFDSKEVKFVLDAKGKVKEIKVKERLDSMRLIEEFMLLANKCATIFVSNLQKETERRLPFIYRVHDDPDPEKIFRLNEFIQQFGYNINISAPKPDKKKLKKLLDLIKGKPEEYIINDLLIRSMAKAIYNEKNTGHYGLGFADYTHFTSPIRRYPDLIVHRLLYEYISKPPKKLEKNLSLNLEDVKDICLYSSQREQNAVTAEREVTKIKQIEYMADKLGNEYEAVISGIIEHGMFVEVMDILIEGLIRFRDIEGDYYVYDEKNHYVYGRRKKKIFRAGDVVNVKLSSVNPETRKIDFKLI